MGVDKSLSLGIYDVLLNNIEPEKRVVPTRYGDVLPSSKGLAGAGVEMVAIQNREHLLRKALEKLAPHYDYFLSAGYYGKMFHVKHLVPLRSPVFHVKHFIVPGKSGIEMLPVCDILHYIQL